MGAPAAVGIDLLPCGMTDDRCVAGKLALVGNQPMKLALYAFRTTHIVVIKKGDEVALRPGDDFVPCASVNNQVDVVMPAQARELRNLR